MNGDGSGVMIAHGVLRAGVPASQTAANMVTRALLEPTSGGKENGMTGTRMDTLIGILSWALCVSTKQIR